MIYTKEEKLKVIRDYLDGTFVYPPNLTKNQKDNIKKRIKRWAGAYLAKGEEALEPKKNHYSYEDKKYAVERFLAGESKYQIAFSFGMKDAKTIRLWVKRYQKYGWDGLKEDGNVRKYFNTKAATKTKLKQAEEEITFLRNKVKELNIEVEYLKKLIALVNQRRGQQI